MIVEIIGTGGNHSNAPMTGANRAIRPLTALFTGAAAIAFAPILVRLSEADPVATAFYRVLFALPFLWLWMIREGKTLPDVRRPQRRADFALIILAGLCFTGDLALWHWSLQLTSVAHSTLLTNFAPVLVAIGSMIFFAEKPSIRLWIGFAVAFLGAGLLVRHSAGASQFNLLGDALAIVTSIFYAGYLLAMKALRKHFSTATCMSWTGLVSCFGFLLVAILSGENILITTPRGWLVVVALGIVTHLGGQTLIAFGLGYLPASFSAVTLLLQPAVAAVLAWMLFHEKLSAPQICGGIVLLLGIVLATQSKDAAKG